MNYGFDVYITGVTGYLGRNLVNHLLGLDHLHKIYGLSRRWDAQEQMPHDPRLEMVTGDVRDPVAVRKFFELGDYRHASFLIHAAAYKHVPMGEKNVNECVTVNIEGTRLLLAEMPRKISKAVMISTDKAVTPVNVYGHTKAIAEYHFLNRRGSTLTSVCRFGNVFGSTGSVVEKWATRLVHDEQPLFRIADRDMTRYWYLIDDAVGYVIDELFSSNNGTIVVPNLQSSSIKKLLTVFVSIAKASGKEPVVLEFPVRPGEKIHESMIHREELVYAAVKEQKNSTIALLRNAYDSPQELNEKHLGLLSSSAATPFTTPELTTMLADYLRRNFK